MFGQAGREDSFVGQQCVLEHIEELLETTDDLDSVIRELELEPGSIKDDLGSESQGTVPRVSRNAATIFEGECEECAICFASLPSAPVCILIQKIYGKKRSCRHYFHQECVSLLLCSTPAPYLCPLCREPFEKSTALPDVRLDSAAWFRAIDNDGTGSLDKTEVIGALSATLPVDPEKLTASLDSGLWDQWDTEGTGCITRESFEHPVRGLLQFVLYSMPSLRREAEGKSTTISIPELDCRESWFRYWDEHSLQALGFQQCLRALARTLRLEGEREEMGKLRNVLSKLWREYGLTEEEAQDKTSEGGDLVSTPILVQRCNVKGLSLALFCEKPDGFCDALLDALKKAFGPNKFCRIRQKAHLLQQPVSILKRELRSLKISHHGAVEKEEIVEAILDAKFPSTPLPTSPSASPAYSQARRSSAVPSIGTSDECDDIKALSLSEIQRRLRLLRVPYGHCLERCELEDLLKHSQKKQRGALPASPESAAVSEQSRPESHTTEDVRSMEQKLPASQSQCCILQ